MDRWWEPPPEPQDAPNGAHLFVCQHGLWGSPEDVSFLEQYLQHNGWLTLNARSNSARCTFDGADVCGDRLAAEVVSHVQRLAAGGIRVTHISFAAYSFGGLIARYAVGKLLASGFFSAIAPVNFLTIATPHLGCWEHPSSMSQLAYNSILPWTLSRTGRQLLLADRWLEPEGLPLLAAMARPDCAFHAALAAFSKRVLLADIRSDRTVPYTTAAITAVNPYFPGGAAAAPSALSPHRTGDGGDRGSGGWPGCGRCRCKNVQGPTFSSAVPSLVEVEGHEGMEGEEDEGGGTDSDAFDGLGLDLDDGDTDGDGVGAGAGGLLRGWSSSLPGFTSVLRFGLGMAALLFRSGGGAGAGARARARRHGLGEGCCSGKGCCVAGVRRGCCYGDAAVATYGAAASAVGQPTAAIIPLPISSAYPCIVTPYPAPAGPPAASGGAAAGQAACPLPYCCGRRLPSAVTAAEAVGTSSGMHRSASSPLPKVRHATGSAYGCDGSSSCRGGGSCSAQRQASHMAAASAGSTRRVPAMGVRNGPQSRKSWWAATLYSSFTHGNNSLGGMGGGIADSTVSNDGCGATSLLRSHTRRSHLYDNQFGAPLPSVTLPSLRYSRSSSAAIQTTTAARNGGLGNWFGGGDDGSDSSQDDRLASRVRLGLFVALLPVLLSLWLCMVAWLAAIWIHHYAVLLTVRPDRSWDVRVRRSAAAVTPEAAEATPDGRQGGDSGTATPPAPPAVAAMPSSFCVEDGSGDGNTGVGVSGSSCGGGELTVPTELLVSLTEAAPPLPLPASPLSLSPQQQRLPCRPEGAQPFPEASTTATTIASMASLLRQAEGALGEEDGCRSLQPETMLPSGSPSVSRLVYSLEVDRASESCSSFSAASASHSGCSSRTQPGTAVIRDDKAPSIEITENDPVKRSVIACGDQTFQVSELVATGELVHLSEPAAAGDPMTHETSSSASKRTEDAGLGTPEGGPAAVIADSAQLMPAPIAAATFQGGIVTTACMITGSGAPMATKSITAVAAAMATAAPVVKAATDCGETSADVRVLVRSIVTSVVQRYDGCNVPLAEAQVQLLGEETNAAAWHLDGTPTPEAGEAAAKASSDAVAGQGVISYMVRSIFQAIVSRQDVAGAAGTGTSGTDSAIADISYTAAACSETTMATQHAAMRGGSASDSAVIVACNGDGARSGFVVSLPNELSNAAAAGTAAAHANRQPMPLLPHHRHHHQQRQGPQEQEETQQEAAQQHQQTAEPRHAEQAEQIGSEVLTAVKRAAAVPAPALRPQNGDRASCRGLDEPRGAEEKAKIQPLHREVAERSPSSRSHDPAALLSEMIANLNQLEWHKVDVDTRHYHAHAAIVIRSSRRFRTHMHIIDYAVRQLRL
ncbi:hypothetical protein VOLCADRAFT_93914 [Volvox carteri f. nagariensis]|uniref:DUF676 domain-containing protein n=1 Tax=Volvox carteri f. nagariensis TaxID=3068 RepID=D8U3E6_VOLCA|nr:uncharacterized protein VOLCADRAFT_93914 [Volvox carteri f. nagariensis]EFJ45813.1 hypothetical protein VOLCADRAFT_93914 [Volvox carteri f. nagariensis]|eukprot:XP_002953214.1 hypothetical protein VOLCADRAFT_93914 [Volvox carteri f. nagariensis]